MKNTLLTLSFILPFLLFSQQILPENERARVVDEIDG